MCLNFKNIINFDEEVDTNLELKEIKLKSEDMIYILFKEVQCLKTEMKKKNYEERIYKEIKNEINDIKEYVNKKIDGIINENQLKWNIFENRMLSLENKINENEKNNKQSINELQKTYTEEIEDIKRRIINLKIILKY